MRGRDDQSIINTLMGSFGVIVLEVFEPFSCPYLDREEVHRGNDAPMHLEKLGPCGAFGSRLCSLEPVLFHDVGDGGACDAVPDLAHLALDPFVAPVPVLCRHADNQQPDLSHDLGSSVSA